MLAESKVVLEWLEWATDEFQTKNVSISRVFPCVQSLIEKLAKVDYEAIHTKQICSDLLDSLMKRFGDLVKNEVFVIATLLDTNFGSKAFPKKSSVLERVRILTKAVMNIRDTQIASVRPTTIETNGQTNYVFYEDDDIAVLSKDDPTEKLLKQRMSVLSNFGCIMKNRMNH
jgi:hypothetical protein